MRIYYLMSDGGDGSASVRFYRNYLEAASLVEGDDYETYGLNEGNVGYFEINSLDSLSHIDFSDKVQVSL